MILAASVLDNADGTFGSLAQGVMDFLTGMGVTSLGGQFVFLALLGVIAVAVFFAVGALVSLKSKTKADTAVYRSATAFINEAGEIDANAAEEINSYLRDLPEPVARGWGNFLEQKVSYPSDYMSEEEVFTTKRYASDFRLGKTLYAVLAAVAALVIVFFATVVAAQYDKNGGLFEDGIAVSLLFQILSVIIAPLILYIVLYAVLAWIYRVQVKKAVAAYREFTAALDGAVTIFRETKTDEEFLNENVEVINEEIEKIIASKIQQNEIIDLVTTPSLAEEEAASAIAAPEPVKEIAPPEAAEEAVAEEVTAEEQPAPVAEPMSKEEEQSQLIVLVSIVDNAIADVRGTTKEDLEELALIIFNAKQSGFQDPKDQEVLDECLHKLSDLYYR